MGGGRERVAVRMASDAAATFMVSTFSGLC